MTKNPRPLPLVFIAGPLTAPTAWERSLNILRAQEVALEVMRLGAAVICPHSNTGAFFGAVDEGHAMASCHALLAASHALVLLPGWEGCRAKEEAAEATALLLPVFEWASPADRADFSRWVASWAPPAPRAGSGASGAPRGGSARLGGGSEGDLSRLRSLLEAATPGPWWVPLSHPGAVEAGAPGLTVCDCYDLPYQAAVANAALVAGAVNALPSLLSQVEGASILASSHAATLRHLQAVEEEHLVALKRIGVLEESRAVWRTGADELEQERDGLRRRIGELERALGEIHRLIMGTDYPRRATLIRDLCVVALNPTQSPAQGENAAPCPGSARLEGVPAEAPSILGRPIGARLRQHRRAGGLTMGNLAERLGKGVEWVSGVERGEVTPTPAELQELVQALSSLGATVPGEWLPQNQLTAFRRCGDPNCCPPQGGAE